MLVAHTLPRLFGLVHHDLAETGYQLRPLELVEIGMHEELEAVTISYRLSLETEQSQPTPYGLQSTRCALSRGSHRPLRPPPVDD